MRIPLLIATAILISTSPVMAKSNDKISNAPVFGSTKCRPTFSCADIDDPERMAMIERQALKIANRCVAQKLIRKSIGTQFFDASYGLNSNLCFKPKKRPKSKSGLSMTPQCCIKVVEGNKNKCYMRCNLVGIR